jgi:tRNA (cytidine32/guanosine34-2'-O)-methyltransferase
MSNPYMDLTGVALSRVNRVLVPFIACGDLSGFDLYDSETCYPTSGATLEPVQKPTAPPYKSAMQMSRTSS